VPNGVATYKVSDWCAAKPDEQCIGIPNKGVIYFESPHQRT